MAGVIKIEGVSADGTASPGLTAWWDRITTGPPWPTIARVANLEAQVAALQALLADVVHVTGTPADGDTLVYDAVLGIWTPAAPTPTPFVYAVSTDGSTATATGTPALHVNADGTVTATDPTITVAPDGLTYTITN